MEELRYIDLFCGIGGMRLGFEKALESLGYIGNAVFSSEIKEHARKAYSLNFNTAEIKGDITKINEYNLPNFKVLLAGFPCQAFSSAGKRLGFDDTRGTLFFDIARILKVKKPSAFLLENVEGLVSHDSGRTLKRMTDVLKDLGYKISSCVLDGNDFGLAQSRRRIYICGLKGTKAISFKNFKIKKSVLSDIIDYNTPLQETDFTRKLFAHYDLNDVIGKQIKDKRGGKNNIHSWDFALKGEISHEQKELLGLILKYRRNKKWADIIGIDWMDGMPLTIDMIKTFYDNDNLSEMLRDLTAKNYLVFEYPKKKEGNVRKYDKSLKKGYNIVTGKLSFEYSRILNPDEATPTIVATDAMKLGVPVAGGIRPLTVREALRLFGFPECYNLEFLEKSKAFDLLGNTVCIPVVEEISKRLIKAVAEKTGETKLESKSA
ncbi:MAG: DNA (cytosine-5-)-methyltransferase [Oscillospiraceae bacterium]|nr:DNA (cytosine-5-)-methyltransferase [Oscillospiraceae bacterium]